MIKIILHPKKQARYLELQVKPFVCGLNRIRYVLFELYPTKECIINKIYNIICMAIHFIVKKKGLYMLECLPKNKWMTLKDNQIFSNENVLIISWLQTLVRGLTGKEKDFSPFWKEQYKEEYQKWWLPTEIDCVDSPLNYSTSSFIPSESNSLFSIRKLENPMNRNSLTTLSVSSTFSHAETWGDEDIVRTRKIRLYPTKGQRLKLKQWIGTTRYIYNRVLHHLKSNNISRIDKKELQKLFITKEYRNGTINSNINDWELETPKDIRNGAIRDIFKAYKTCFSQLDSGYIDRFKLSYRKKHSSSSLEIDKKSVKIKEEGLLLYPTYKLGPIKLPKREKKLKNIDNGCRLQYKYNQWFLCIPITKKRELNNPMKDIVALDPGTCTFQTCYSQEEVFKCQQTNQLLEKLRDKIAFFQSLRAKKIIRGYSYKRRIQKLYCRHKNLVDSIHYQTCSALKDYKVILLPIFESQEMVRKSNLNKKTKQDLLGLKHYLFQQRLIDYGKKNNIHVVIVSEIFTTQTCGFCGFTFKVDGRYYQCPVCHLLIDRDINAARNILLKYITERILNNQYD
jgi:putative transposase